MWPNCIPNLSCNYWAKWCCKSLHQVHIRGCKYTVPSSLPYGLLYTPGMQKYLLKFLLSQSPTASKSYSVSASLLDGLTALRPTCLTASFPYCLTSSFHDCLIAFLPDCLSALLPDCLTALLPDCPTNSLTSSLTALLPDYLTP